MLLHDARAREAIVRRLEALKPDSERRWGRMRADQMLHHMNVNLEMALGRVSPARRDSLFKRTVFKFVAFRAPWPKGKAPTAPELVAADTYDFEKERTQLKLLLEEVGTRSLQADWPPHPAFGPLSGREWSRLEYRHFQHHLEQFGV